MPYIHRKIGNKTCVYKKDGGTKVGCTSGDVDKYLSALYANANESAEFHKGLGYELDESGDDIDEAIENISNKISNDPNHYSKLGSIEENKKFIGKMFSEEIQKILK